MNRRTIAILVGLVGIILLGAVGFFYIQSQNADSNETTDNGTEAEVLVNAEGTPLPTEEGAPPPEFAAALEDLPPMVEVVVSLQTVPRGWRITENELTMDLRIAEEVPNNVIYNPEDVIGKFARSDIFQGETLTLDDVVEDVTLIGQEEYGPSSLIPPGFIAAGIPMDRLSSVAYGVNAGDYVDIMITFVFAEIDEEFQYFLPNAAVLFLNEEGLTEGDELPVPSETTGIHFIGKLGRFEELPTGELVHVSPNGKQRPIPVSMVLQNARVIQVGEYFPGLDVQPPTPTPEPIEEGEPTPTPEPNQQPTATPVPPTTVVVALSPQQQLFLKYAIESNADIDLALRGINDGQLYEVQNIDLSFFLEQFGIEIPPNFDYTVDDIPIPDLIYDEAGFDDGEVSGEETSPETPPDGRNSNN